MDSKLNQKETYLSSKEVGKILGYTHDYVSRLCRQGHMVGIRKGREWYVVPSEIEIFKQKHELILQEKKKQLSQKLSVIRKKHEAQKRQAKQIPKVEPQESTYIEDTFKTSQSEHDPVVNKKVQISVPKKIIATIVLAGLICLPSILSSTSKTSSVKMRTTTSVNQSVGVTDSFVASIKELPMQTIKTTGVIGDSYLVVYQIQGQIIYQSLEEISKVGDVVVFGYELVGRSLWYGGSDILNRFGRIIGSSIGFSQKKIFEYTNNVSEGYAYVSDQFFFVFKTGIAQHMSEGFSILTKNINQNVFAMTTFMDSISNSLHASMVSLFSNTDSKINDSVLVIPVK